jgi:hypothetical protein
MLGSNPALLQLWHWQPDALTTWLDLIHNLARSYPHLARSHPHLARPHPHLARSHPHLAISHPNLARSHSHLARSHPHLARSHTQLGYISSTNFNTSQNAEWLGNVIIITLTAFTLFGKPEGIFIIHVVWQGFQQVFSATFVQNVVQLV